MICEKCNRFLAIAVLFVTLCHRTTGGSWKNLERKLVQGPHGSDYFDENRIIFPETGDDSSEEDSSEHFWRPTAKPRDEVGKQGCYETCPTSREYSPVCGTNGVTYQNMKQLQCAMTCGYRVDLHRPGPCVTQVTNSPPVATTGRNQEWCIQSCPTTSEYNPVCGTNDVTYNNIGKLECAKYCGVAVELSRRAPCASQLIRSTTSAPTPPSSPDEETQDCINSCPMTSRYDPVCGSDYVTYRNIGKLECAKACGVDVVLRHLRPCKATQSEEDDYDSGIDPRSIVPEFKMFFRN
ncbi:agrin-like [Epargyreus clarus]|uniref:agrin-like n=1 Tax=Epargyreus clarus TaxID=520877 RepID=UPI003C2B1E9B